MSEPSDSLSAKLRVFALAIARRGARLRLAQTAASLAFLTMLAMVPIVTLAISLVGALPAFASTRETLLKFFAANLFLPSFSDTVVRYLDEFATKSAELSLIGAVVFFATAFFALLTIEGTLNRIWDASQPRPLARRLTIYWTFLTLGPLLFAATIAVNGVIVSDVLAWVSLPALRKAWLLALPWLTSIVGMTLLYRIVPNAPVRWRDALAGAIVAAVVLEGLKRGMGFQVAKLPTYTVVYGAFAALPLFLVWLFLLWLTVLAGALVAASTREWGAAPQATQTAGSAPATRFERAAAVLGALGSAAAQGRVSMRAGELRDLLGDDPVHAEDTARLLCGLGYLDRLWRLSERRSSDSDGVVWNEHWMLADGAQALSLRPLFECLWNGRAPGAAGEPAGFDLARIDLPLSARNGS